MQYAYIEFGPEAWLTYNLTNQPYLVASLVQRAESNVYGSKNITLNSSDLCMHSSLQPLHFEAGQAIHLGIYESGAA